MEAETVKNAIFHARNVHHIQTLTAFLAPITVFSRKIGLVYAWKDTP